MNPCRDVLAAPHRVRRLPLPGLLALAALGVAGVASAQQRAELPVTVTVVRSCTVIDGAPDCGSAADTDAQAVRSPTQPAPRTTTTPSPPATEPGEDRVPPQSAGHTIVTIQF